MTNDLADICRVAKTFDKLLLVDAISSLGCINLPVDDWHCDVVVTASQKGWMVPPGLAMLSVSEKAWQAHAHAKMPRYYWDFSRAKDYLQKGQTPWTPAVSVCYALDVTLDLMLAEGLHSVFARHARVGELTRNGVKALGFSLFSGEKYASNTVTAVNGSDMIDVSRLIRILREKYDVVVAGGQQKLAGKIFRIGHLGSVYDRDIESVLEAISRTLPEVKKD
jgi:aspartate aminotransferase-like enzyme